MGNLIFIYLAINVIGMLALVECGPPKTTAARFVCGAVIVICPLALVALFVVLFTWDRLKA